MVRELMDILIWGFSFFLMADVLRRVIAGRRNAAQGLAGPAQGHRAMLDIADQLEEQHRYGDATLLYERVLARNENDPRALHGLARCRMEQADPQRALALFEALMGVDPRYRKYGAALEYAEVLHVVGRCEDAVELLEGMVKETGRLNHSLALAHYLELAHQPARARAVLEQALTKYEGSPAPEQEANRRWQRRIEEKLSELERFSEPRQA